MNGEAWGVLEFVRQSGVWTWGLYILGALGSLVLVQLLLGMRYIPNDSVAVVEKLWSAKGSIPNGRIVALQGEAGYQAHVLRGGIHFWLWLWQYRIHKTPLVMVRQGRIGYVYARDGESLSPGQTLGRVIECDAFQDAEAFLTKSTPPNSTGMGQRGRQRAILREGVYAINPALFVVLTEDKVYKLSGQDTRQEGELLKTWQQELHQLDGFRPVLVGQTIESPDPLRPGEMIKTDSMGIVTVHDGPSLPAGEIIAPAVGNDADQPNFHDNFQDPEAFLRAGGRRGLQLIPLTDGTYFINRWFARVEMVPKTVVPIGYVGVVVSYHGKTGHDLSGDSFRHGELVADGERGVLSQPLGPGKYPFNRYAGSIVLVPTTNFVLHWVTGKTESHRYDESLRSIDLVTRDAYEPALPLSVVVHIDYQKAPNVIQRFGDVKKLITQTLDPMLSAYFRDIAHKKTMLELLHERDLIQIESRRELCNRFHQFDIECVDVLIGKPDSPEGDDKIEVLLEQLRLRQLSIEQLETYERQRAAAEKLRVLNEAQTRADSQTHLTQSQVQIQVEENKGEADLARARKQADQAVVMAEAELAKSRKQAEQTVVLAEADSRSRILSGQGEGQRRLREGLAEAVVLARKISSMGDPRLYAMTQVAERLAQSRQPLVPERLFVGGGEGGSGSGTPQGPLAWLINLLVSEKFGLEGTSCGESPEMNQMAEQMTSEALRQLAVVDAESTGETENQKSL